MSRFSLVLAGALLATLVAAVVSPIGGALAASPARPSERNCTGTTLIQLADCRISPTVAGRDRRVLESAFLGFYRTRHVFPNLLYVVVPTENRIYVNRPELNASLLEYTQVPGHPTVATDHHGHYIAVPAPYHGYTTGKNPPTDNHGAFRRLASQQGWGASFAYVSLVCNGTYPTNDNPYVYFGNFSAPWTGEYEAGLAYDVAGTVGGHNTWTLYLKIGPNYYFSTQKSGSQNGGWLWNSGVNPPSGYIDCTSGNLVNTLSTWYDGVCNQDPPEGVSDGYPPCLPPDGPWSQFYAMVETPGGGNCNFVSVCMGILYDYPAYPYLGWDDVCGACVVSSVTSLAQTVQNLGDGASFGPIGWGGITYFNFPQPGPTATASAVNTTVCQDYLPWTVTGSPTAECQNGPPTNALHKEVQVQGFDFYDETITITNNGT